MRSVSYIGPAGLIRQSAPLPGDRVRVSKPSAKLSGVAMQSVDVVHSVSRAGVVLTLDGVRFNKVGRELSPFGIERWLVGPEYDVQAES